MKKEVFDPSLYFCSNLAVNDDGTKVALVSSGGGADVSPVDWNGLHILSMEKGVLYKKQFQQYEPNFTPRFVTDTLASVNGRLVWKDDKLEVEPFKDTRQNKQRDAVTLPDGTTLQTHWAYFPRKPNLVHVNGVTEKPVHIDAKETFGFSGNLQIQDNVIAVHCDHMNKGAYTTTYKNGKFQNWLAHPAVATTLTKQGLWVLGDKLTLVPMRELANPAPDLGR